MNAIDTKLRWLKDVPAFKRWYRELSLEPLDDEIRGYRAFHARVDQMIYFLDIFWPNFIEIRGLVLRDTKVPSNLEEVISQFEAEGRPLESVEYLYNHLHITDICLNDPDHDDIEQATFVAIAKTVEEMWRQRLKTLFPDRTFVVGVGNEDTEVEVYAYTQRSDE